MDDEVLEQFRTKFRVHDLELKGYEHWVVSLRPAQPTLGSMVLSLRRPCEALGDLNADETTELANVFSQLEEALEASYRPDRVNYLALMMVDPPVHFHVIPRYSDARELQGRDHLDPAWPGPPDVLAALPLDEADVDELVRMLRAALA